MLIVCNVFAELEHFILFNNFDKYHNFIYYRINIKLMFHREFMSRCSHAASTVRAPVFGRHQFFGTSEHYGKAHGSFLSGWMNYNYTACCWFPTSSNILILPSQFWQIRFESYWFDCTVQSAEYWCFYGTPYSLRARQKREKMHSLEKDTLSWSQNIVLVSSEN